jgi:DNA-binding SARP family transcriptional activator
VPEFGTQEPIQFGAREPIQFGLLGPIRAANGAAVAVLPAKERIVLATLLLRAGEAASISTLIEALWDDEPPVTARNGVQGHVKQLRRLLGPAGGRIITRTPGYLIEVRPGELDLDSFIRLTGSARSAAKAGAWEDAVTAVWEVPRRRSG